MLKLSREIEWKSGETSCARGFARMRELGYEACDYQVLCCEPARGVYALKDSEFERLMREDAQAARENGIFVGQTHGVWPYDDRIPEQAELKFEATVKGLAASAILGAPYMVIHPVMPFFWDVSPHHEEDKEKNIEFIRRVLPYARKYNVKLALENMPCVHVPCGHVSELKECIDLIHDEYLVACLDTGHCMAMGDDAGDMARLLGDRLKVLHVHDNRVGTDAHLIPYFGHINWSNFRAALMEIGYEGTLSMETDAPANMPEPFRTEVEALEVRLLAQLNY